MVATIVMFSCRSTASLPVIVGGAVRLVDAVAAREQVDRDVHLDRLESRIERTAQSHPHDRSHSRVECGLDRGRIDDREQDGALVAGVEQRSQDHVRVARRTRARRVGRVGEDRRPVESSCRLDRILDRDQLRLHPRAIGPEGVRQQDRLALGRLGVTVRDHDRLAAELGHVRERVADHEAGRERDSFALELPGPSDDLAVEPCLGYQLVTAHESRNDHARDHRLRTVEDAKQQPRGARARVGHVDVRVGLEQRQPVDLLEHLRREDPVQVERDHDRDLVPDDPAALLEQVPLGIGVAVGAHRAVEREVDGVDPCVAFALTSARSSSASRSKPARDSWPALNDRAL